MREASHWWVRVYKTESPLVVPLWVIEGGGPVEQGEHQQQQQQASQTLLHTTTTQLKKSRDTTVYRDFYAVLRHTYENMLYSYFSTLQLNLKSKFSAMF